MHVLGMAAGLAAAFLLMRDLPGDAHATAATRLPEIVVDPYRSELGEFVAGDSVEVTLTLRNRGQRRLIVNEEQCHCRNSESRASTIVDPGKKKTLNLRFEVADTTGPTQHEWKFTTNDPARPRFSVVTKATVIPSSAKQ